MTKGQMIIFFIVVVPILLIQGFWIFNDARKRGYKFYWLWGIFGLMNTPGNLLAYLLISRFIIDKKLNKKNKN